MKNFLGAVFVGALLVGAPFLSACGDDDGPVDASTRDAADDAPSDANAADTTVRDADVRDASQDVADSAVADAAMDAPRTDAGTPVEGARVFFFGHSLAAFTEPGDKVGSHLCELARLDGLPCCADGSYPPSFLPSAFANYPFPPENSHGHQPGCWTDDDTFESAAFDRIVITETNFMWRERTADSFGPDGRMLIDRIEETYPEVPLYLYEHWPEFGRDQFTEWKNTMAGEFHTWFVALQDALRTESGRDVKLVPVGRIFAGLLAEGRPLESLTFDDLFVDDAPHGNINAYFLAGLVHYMTIYRRRPEGGPPSGLHATLTERYDDIVAYAWAELGHADLEGRVW